MHMVTCRRAIT